jgi:hypothetical protein
MKKDLIGKWYNPDLTDEQNVSLLKEHGISISKRTLITWRKNQGIAKQRGGDRKSIDFKNQSAIFKVQNIADKSKCNFQSANSSENQSEEIKVQLLTNQSAKITKSKCKNQDAILENQSIISDQSIKIKVSNPLNQSAISEEESDVLDWDNEDEKFVEIMPKGRITSEMYDKMFGDDSVPHYTGKTPPKQITLETFRNETEDLPVKDVKYYLSKNLPEVIDDAEEFKKWINATFYLLKGTKNWTDYLLHRETYSKILAAANRGYSADYEKGTTVEQWQIQRAKDSYYKMWENYKYPYFEKKYSNEPYNVACEDLYKTYGIVPMRLEDYRRIMDEKMGKKQEKINSDPNWQPFSMKGNTYADEDYDEDEEEEIERKNCDKDISNKAVNGMTNEEMMRFVCDGNF